jgi:molybdate transport system substrate-binding protein
VALNVSAAMSLKDVMLDMGEAYHKANPGVEVVFNFASSGTLQHQIEQGAPVDLFLSAGEKQVDVLYEKGLVKEPLTFAVNRLVLVVPPTNSETPVSLQALAGNQYEKIAIGEPDSVPAGKYAQESLEKAGIWGEIQPKLVLAKDVRQVLTYVATGNADAGLVYKTDALASGQVSTALLVPAEFHAPIVYPAAVTKNATRPKEAARFLDFLMSGEARAIFQRYGFAAPLPPGS